MFRINRSYISATLGALLAINTVFADDRALVIGVGQYQSSSNNLDGIDLDVDATLEMAQMMGFRKNQIKVLQDSRATLRNVQQAMKTWVVDGVSKSDRVLIYFSGHGTRIPDQNGDEKDDKLDEVLVLHDFKYQRVNNRDVFNGVLVDDEFSEFLADIPSQNTLVLIDACHSGTATKSLRLDARAYGKGIIGQEKFLDYGAVFVKSSSRGFSVEPGNKSANFVSISAAGDNERAIATSHGSIFTQGLLEAVQHAYRSKAPLTAASLHKSSLSYVTQKMHNTGKEFYPVINPKNSPLTTRDIRIVSNSTDSGTPGPRWRKMVNIADSLPSLPIRLNQKSFREGDAMVMTITVPPGGGYLNVINIEANDKATTLFPNAFEKDNFLPAGELTIPTNNMKFNLNAGPPFGRALVMAVLSKKPLNSYNSGKGDRDEYGDLIEPFAELSTKSTRGFSVVAKNSDGGSDVLGGYVITSVSK